MKPNQDFDISFIKQSAENRRKERNQFWLRLHHTLILISNGRTSASKKINLMVDPNCKVSTVAFERNGKDSTVFGRL